MKVNFDIDYDKVKTLVDITSKLDILYGICPDIEIDCTAEYNEVVESDHYEARALCYREVYNEKYEINLSFHGVEAEQLYMYMAAFKLEKSTRSKAIHLEILEAIDEYIKEEID